MVIIVDVMGGDNAPEETVKGACEASREYDAKIIMVGDSQRIAEVAKKCSLDLDGIEIVDAATDVAIAKYHNDNADSNEGRMFSFKADLSEFMGSEVYIRVVDNADSAWGCLAVDSFITHYASIEDLPEATLIESKI